MEMQFSPDVNKQAVQVIFRQMRSKPPLSFDGSLVPISDDHKHMSFFLDRSQTLLGTSGRQ